MRSLSYRFALIASAAVTLSACTPSHDWRTVRAGSAEALFPCKPVTAARQVALLDQTRTMSLSACAVDEVTYAVSWVSVASAGEAAAVATALSQAQTNNLRSNSAVQGTLSTVVTASAALQALVIGPPPKWQQAQKAGHVEQFLTGLRAEKPRP